MCISPYTKVDYLRHELTHVPCGKCFECVRKKKLGWEIRLSRAAAWSDSAFFCLLSFDEEHYPIDAYDHKYNYLVIKKFIARLRKRIERNFGKHIKLKYYIASEYGELKDRLHFHALFFIKGYQFTWLEFASVLHDYYIFDRVTGRTFNQRTLPDYVVNAPKIYDKHRHKVDRYKVTPPSWNEGFIGNVYNIKFDKKRMKYTLKYIQKQYNKSFFSRFRMSEILSPEEVEDIKSSWSKDDIETVPSIAYNGRRVPIPYYWTTLLFDLNTRYEIRRHLDYINLHEDVNLWLYKSKQKLKQQILFENSLN